MVETKILMGFNFVFIIVMIVLFNNIYYVYFTHVVLLQIEEVICELTEMDKSCQTEVKVTQEDSSSSLVYELQELSEFDPSRLTHISAVAHDDPSAFTVQVVSTVKGVNFMEFCNTIIAV